MAKVPAESKVIQEIAALVFIAAGVLLLLALISYTPADLSNVVSPPNNPVVNFIGPVGAYSAQGLSFTFGLASYLFPLLFFLTAIKLITSPNWAHWWKVLWKLLWAVLIVLTGAGLVQWSQRLFGSLWATFNQGLWGGEYVGGYVGWVLSDRLLVQYMGPAGAFIVMVSIYLTSLVLLFDIRPMELLQSAWFMFGEWREEQQKKKLDRLEPTERLEFEQRQLTKQLEQQEKELMKKFSRHGLPSKPAPVAEPPREEKEKARPRPKVIDTTAMAEPAEVPEPVKEEEPPPPRPEKPPMKRRESSRKESEPEGAALVVPDVNLSPVPGNYRLPDSGMLIAGEREARSGDDEEELQTKHAIIVSTLEQFGIAVEKDYSDNYITKGASITMFEVRPSAGVRVERIANLQKNLARALKAERINILAPIPGKDTVGIEVGNTHKVKIVLRELFESEAWKNTKARLPVVVGKDIYGKTLVADLAEMPHLLIAGTTGSGKSVCINCVLMSLLYRFRPDELKLILVDPKVVELQVYNTLPHLVVPVVTDSKKVLIALRWVINEMEKRYRMMASVGVRNIVAFNARPIEKAPEPDPAEKTDRNVDEEISENERDAEFELPGMAAPRTGEELPDRLPYVVVIIDELADLMQTTPADVELAIARLSAKARAAGIHLIIATQTPRANVITGVIKTNVPCRIAFQVPSGLDSRVILDENGAENLLGKGDLLYLPPGSSKLIRAQGAFVSDDEVAKVVAAVSSQTPQKYEAEIHEKLTSGGDEEDDDDEEDEALYDRCIEVIRQEKRASASLLQRRLKIGYNTAARMIDKLEKREIIGPKEGSKDREILVDLDRTEP